MFFLLISFSEGDFHWTFLNLKLIYITKMDVETIYKDKLKGKYKFMFDLKEKQSVWQPM